MCENSFAGKRKEGPVGVATEKGEVVEGGWEVTPWKKETGR